jgi:hypothetical protein
MTTIFGNNRSHFLIRTDGAGAIQGNDGSDILLGGGGGNLAVRTVTTASIAVALSISLVAMTWAQTAAIVSPSLKGAYGFTGSAVCLVAPGSTVPPGPNPTPGVALPNSGFDPVTLRPIDGKVFSYSFTVEGIRVFNGDGTGTVRGTTVAVTVPPTPQPPGFPNFAPSASSADFGYLLHLYGRRRGRLDVHDGARQLPGKPSDRSTRPGRPAPWTRSRPSPA